MTPFEKKINVENSHQKNLVKRNTFKGTLEGEDDQKPILKHHDIPRQIDLEQLEKLKDPSGNKFFIAHPPKLKTIKDGKSI